MADNELFFESITSEAQKIDPPGNGDVLAWLGEKETNATATRDAGLQWLLATTFGEVVWGLKKGEGGWALSNGPGGLAADSLLELRAFGPDAEIFVWRDAAGLRARRRRDGAGDKEYDIYPEEQLLWGTVRLDDMDGGFTRLVEGDQGLVHAPPLALDESYFDGDGHRPARLVLRHYVGRCEATGLARVVDSRLVGVESEPPPGQGK